MDKRVTIKADDRQIIVSGEFLGKLVRARAQQLSVHRKQIKNVLAEKIDKGGMDEAELLKALGSCYDDLKAVQIEESILEYMKILLS